VSTAPIATVTVHNATVVGQYGRSIDLGPGFTDPNGRQVVRTAGDRVYVFAADDTAAKTFTGPGVIHAYRSTTTGLPAAFAEADAAHRPHSSASTGLLPGLDVRLDRAGVAHVVYADNSTPGEVMYVTYSTVTDTWGVPQVIGSGTGTLARGRLPAAVVLDGADHPHVIYSDNTHLWEVASNGTTWSARVPIAAGIPSHPALAADAAGALYASWLDSGPTPAILYSRRAPDGTWSAIETVATGVLAGLGHDVDQGPSIVVTPNGKIAVSYETAMPEQHAKLAIRTASGWVVDQQIVEDYAHDPQVYAHGEDLYQFLGHDVNIHFGYRAHLAGQAWGAYNELTTVPRDGSASVRWDPLRETNSNIIDASYFDEDVRHDGSFVAELYYVAVKPEVSTATADTTPPTVSIAAPVDTASVNSTVPVSATATDATGVVGVQLKVDGTNLGPELTAAPYTRSWDTTLLTQGPHTITAVARDAAGNLAVAASVTVTVTPPPPITLVRQLGSSGVGNTGKTAVLTLANGVALGDTLIVFAGISSKGIQLTSIADSRGNTYTVDAAINHPTQSMNSFVGSGYVSAPLLAGDTITATFSASLFSTRSITAADFKGIAAINRVDQVVTQTGSSATLSTPFSANTAQNDELLVAGAGVDGGLTNTFTPGNAFTALTPVSATLGTVTRTLQQAYRIVTGIGQYRAQATLSAGAFWDDALVTYRAAVDSAPPPVAGADLVGQWQGPVDWPLVAVHGVLQPTGQILVWDGFSAGLNSEKLWDPVTGTFSSVASGNNLFCAGHVALPDGKTLVLGGHVKPYVGLNNASIFDPATKTWAAGTAMTDARWYPTATELPSGKVLVVSGDNLTSGDTTQPSWFIDSSNTLPEIYDPVANSWTDFPNSRMKLSMYPQMFDMPDGRVIDTGPDPTTRIFDPASGAWSVLGDSGFTGHAAVMYRPGKILKAGTYAEPGNPLTPVDARASVLDLNQASPTWRAVTPMAFGRSYLQLTVLPDGNVLSTGGESATDGIDLTKAVLPAEMWDATTEKWTTLASMATPRMYHSIALLLPDARVLLAGGGQLQNSTATNETNSEIFSPPYLFKGARPTISSVQTQIDYGLHFTISTPDATSIQSVALVRPGAVTHSIDMQQRYIPLTFTKGVGTLDAIAPSDAATAPSGYYMLFIVNGNGVPSVAGWVRLPAPWEDSIPPTAPSALSASGVIGQASLTWTAATDNKAVARYEVYRSTTPNVTATAANWIAETVTTSYVDKTLPGTYSYGVTAVDGAGNAGPLSNIATVNVLADTTGPTVAISNPAPGQTIAGTIAVTANASDNVGVAGVQLRLDGLPLGAEATAAPYNVSWDTTQASNGTHTLTAVARDNAGNTTTSVAVAVTVFNAGAGIQFVKDLGAANAANTGQTVQLTLASAVAQGHTAIVFAAISSTGIQINSITDTRGNTYTIDATANHTGTSLNSFIGSGYIGTALQAGDKITVTFSASLFTTRMISAADFAGIASINRVDLATTSIGSSATPNTLNITTALPGELLTAGFGFTNATTLTPTFPFSALTPTSATLGTVTRSSYPAWWTAPNPGTYKATGTLTAAAQWTAALVAYKPDATGPPAGDTTPPSAPSALSGSGVIGQASLTWTAATDNKAVARYEVYRSATPNVTATPANWIAETTTTSYVDRTLPGTYSYEVTAVDGAGNTGPPSNIASVSVLSDTIAPTVAISNPAAGQTVAGTIAVTAGASDNVGVTGVQLRLDGQPLGAEATAAPYGTSWDTTQTFNGTHTVTAVARDNAGNLTTSAAVVVTVFNAGAGIQFAKDLGAANAANTGQTVQLTLASGVAQGHTAIVFAAISSTGIAVTSITDTRGNIYTVDATANHTGTSLNSFIGSGYIATALQVGDKITVTFSVSLFTTRMISAADFSGIASTNRVDLATTSIGSSATPSTLSLTTALPGELLVAGFGSTNATTFTSTFPFSALTPTSATLGSVTRSSYTAWWTAPSSSAYKASGTFAAAAQWTAGLVAYKAGP
jgi:fibronectin type 3 domain-containing protein